MRSSLEWSLLSFVMLIARVHSRSTSAPRSDKIFSKRSRARDLTLRLERERLKMSCLVSCSKARNELNDCCSFVDNRRGLSLNVCLLISSCWISQLFDESSE